MTTLSFHQSVQKRIRWEEIDGLRENGRKDSQHVPAARLLQRAVRKSGSAWLKRKKKNYKVVNAISDPTLAQNLCSERGVFLGGGLGWGKQNFYSYSKSSYFKNCNVKCFAGSGVGWVGTGD